MICPNCGKENAEGAKFCKYCGTKLNSESANEQGNNQGMTPPPQGPQGGYGYQYQGQAQFNGMPKAYATKPPRKPLSTGAKVGIGVACGLVAVLIIYLIMKTFFPGMLAKRVDLNDYMTVTFSGYEGYGKAESSFDSDRFISDNMKQVTKRLKKYANSDDYEMKLLAGLGNEGVRELVSGSIDYSFDKTEGLNSGDTVTVTWIVDDDFEKITGIKLLHEDKEFKVEGLEKVESFDPFEGLEVNFSGIAPNGTAELDTSNASWADSLSFELDKYDGLSNGNTVTVTVRSYDGSELSDYCIQNYGKVPSSETKEFTVSGLANYVEKLSEIPDDTLSVMKQQAEDALNAHVAQYFDSDVEFKGMTYLGEYMLTPKASDAGYDSNDMYLVYQVKSKETASNYDNTVTKKKTVTYYWYCMFRNIIADGDGSVYVDTTNYSTPSNTFYSTIDEDGVYKSWYYYGFEDLSDLYSTCVTQYIDRFNHEDNVADNGDNTSDNTETTTDVTHHDEDSDHTDDANHDSTSVSDSSGTTTKEKGIIFPTSSMKVISKKKIAALSDSKLRKAINEIYARHGYKFNNKDLLEYYSKYDWYEPTESDQQAVKDSFNSTEQTNISRMEKERDSRK